MFEDNEILKIENEGYEKGNNPMFGEYRKIFNFEPIPYGNRERHVFKEKVASELKVNYVYFGEVRVSIILYLNEQKRFETPELADLDNYAKLICDAIKGPKGILIDDAQIQSLSISWIETEEEAHFELKVSGHPDDFVMKPLQLYEMSNKLFYPISSEVWTTEGVKLNEKNNVLLIGLDKMIGRSKTYRHSLRQEGHDLNKAFYQSRRIAPVLMGFHKNRIIDSGFEVVELKHWNSSDLI
ncbi:RusA family crossover junction endodeoxyribonuclease [Paenibacillus sp. FSL R7-0272]|uniref:RusA family crossover junction endodeoxyribonuclease n=1 Tax=Paenibacillus sp. FSL R7-0272 TaxID=2921679 RepID=UPI0030EC1063